MVSAAVEEPTSLICYPAIVGSAEVTGVAQTTTSSTPIPLVCYPSNSPPPSNCCDISFFILSLLAAAGLAYYAEHHQG